ncbi:hypothetical protein AGMMS49546_25290 [Spirochaetia bacterium]|nr:hypothetical protein AGMMS49546_25290 [Spirochaetia bacterium]
MANKVKKQPATDENSSKSELIRRFKAQPFIFIGTIVILIIVIVAFVFVPAIVPSAGGGASVDLNFGAYDKIPINYVPGNYFSQMYALIESNQRSSINENNSQFMGYQIWRQAFEETVVHTAILQEMKKAGYTTPKETVDLEVARQFQDENGRFSAARYRQVDNSTRMTMWRQAQERLTQNRYLMDIEELSRAPGEVTFIANMAARQRRFDGAAFSVTAYPEQEIIAYAAENPTLFRSLHLSRITINASEREAQQVLASIKGGTSTFEDAARTHSQDGYAEQGGDMGIKMAYEFSSEGLDAGQQEQLAGLSRGEFSEIYKLGSGWAFFRAEDSAYAVDTGDQTALGKIRSYVMEFERGRIEDYYFKEAEDLARIAVEIEQNQTPVWSEDENGNRVRIGSTGFDEAVYQKRLQKFSFGPVSVNYGDVEFLPRLSSFSAAELASAASNDNFWITAFSTPLYTPSKPMVLGNNIVILYPLEESTAKEEDLEMVKTYYSYALSYFTEQSIHSFFLKSEKLEDRFIDTFFKYFWN